jgi:hypothetical protein
MAEETGLTCCDALVKNQSQLLHSSFAQQDHIRYTHILLPNNNPHRPSLRHHLRHIAQLDPLRIILIRLHA